MSKSTNPPSPPPYTEENPPPYDDAEDDNRNTTVQPTTYILSGQSIHAESTDTPPLYTLNRGVASLTHATPKVELSRVDQVIRTHNGPPSIRPRPRHIYNISHIRAVLPVRSPPSDAPPFYVEPYPGRMQYKARRRDFLGIKKSRMRSNQWRAQPLRNTESSHSIRIPAYARDEAPRFEIHMKDGRYEWTDAEGAAIAVEDAGEEQHRLVVSVPLDRSTADALVAVWCCRLWQCNAEHDASLQSGMDSVRAKMGMNEGTHTYFGMWFR